MKNWCKSFAVRCFRELGTPLLFFFFFTSNNLCSAQTVMIPCNTYDSLILVELYWSTNGPNWNNNTNWLSTPVFYWQGVLLTEDSTPGQPYRVWTLALDYNNLSGTFPPLIGNLSYLQIFSISHNAMTGVIPQSFSQMPHLKTLLFQNNHFTDPLPSFSNSPLLIGLYFSNNDFHGAISDTLMNHFGLSEFQIDGNNFHSIAKKDILPGYLGMVLLQNNHFTFEDILPYAQATGSAQYQCTYYPQDSILEEIDTTLLVGADLLLDSWVDTCQDNKYRWKKNGVFLTPFSVTNSQYIKSNIQFADSGYYTCDVTNWHAFYLTLHRRLIHVRVVDSTVDVPVITKPEIEIQYNISQAFLDINIQQNLPHPLECNLYDMTGRQVLRLFRGEVKQQRLHYYLREMNLHKGTYIVKLNSNDKQIIKKIILP